MKNPRLTAIISLVAIAAMVGSIIFNQEAPSMTVMVLQWIFLVGSLIALVGSLIQMAER